MGSPRTTETKSTGFSIVHSESPEISERTCKKCGKTYEDVKRNFYVRSDSPEGYRGDCKKCAGERQTISRGVKKTKCKATMEQTRALIIERAAEILLAKFNL